MIKNYFKIALRNIKRNSTYSILNISGMAIGMASAILILLWVQFEWSYDKHFNNADDLYRLIEIQNFSGGEISQLAATPGALSAALKNEYPEIIRSSRYSNPPFAFHKGDVFINEKNAMVDKDFLKMFDIKFIRGDINNTLNEPHNIVITEKIARKYFGNEDPLGKTLTAINFVFTITGVVKSMPLNSHIQFDILFSFEGTGVPLNDWRVRCYNYLELKKGTDSKTFGGKIQNFIKDNKKASHSEIFLQNIKKIHLYSSRKYVYDISGHGDITYVRIMNLIAIFILLIACINFMSLSTAQSSRRSREIAVRKMAGANKLKIVVQFLGESLLIVLVAHIIAMILVELLLPGFNNLTGKQLVVNYRSAGLYVGLITVILLCGLLAGSYPAFYLSSLKPMNIMKGINTMSPGNTRFRRVLVIFQFTLSVILIICTLIVGTQLKYMQIMNLGYNKDNIGYFQFPIRPGDPLLGTLKKELGNNQDIESITIGDSPLNTEWTSNGYNWTGKKTGDDVLFHRLGVDEDYSRTFQLMIKEGRFFSPEFSTDANAIVINEQAARIMGLNEPIREILTTPQGSKLTIIGVVKNFHFQSLHYKIGPLIMHIGASNVLFVRIKPGKTTSTVDYIEKIYKSFNPSEPLNFHFLDDDFDNLYRTEQRIGKIFGSFSILAIIISCLGLIGLSSFMAERRTKEIGIRIINGAKTLEIFSLLSGEYILLVMIAIIIASPVAWHSMHKWLQNYAYRISITWWVFAMAGTIALLIAFLTVSWQSYKAACKNPVDALRYE
jgi:putative ABC transport system permease protein